MRKTVLIHPGFHKTGTTTVQRGLWCRRKALAHQLDMLILKDIRHVSLSAKACSTQPTPGKLSNLFGAMASVLASRDCLDMRPLLISSEALVGQIPGRNGFHSYAHAPVLLDRMIQAIRRHFQSQVDVIVWFTTRDPESWRRSVYFQNVKTDRVKEGFAAFEAKLMQAMSLDQIVHAVRTHLAGEARVLSSRLEGAGARPLGLMSEVFDILGVPWQDPVPPVRQNAQSFVLLDALLRLNRSALCDADVSAAKNNVLTWYRDYQRQARRQGDGVRP